MSTSAFAGDDPRDAEGEVKLSLPETWPVESMDGLSSSMMFISGMIMVTRNRYLAWPSFVLSINSVINQHPLRTKEGGSGSASTLMLGVAAIVASYLPLIMIGPARPVAPAA
ncbi:hypothetical protein C8Q76DRAFT_164177 [Earliella scabrosa]|nr:hypothetical protein C8Q76DRAFT_164177 [Earliella scabrosa]